MTLTFKFDLYKVTLNNQSKYLGRRSSRSMVTGFIHTTDRVPYLDH